MSKYLVDIDGKKVEYIIKDKVGFEDCVEAYRKIIERLFPDIPDMDNNGNITAFAPYMYDLAETYAIITLCTDLTLDGVDNEDIWNIMLDGDVLDRINSNPLHERAIAIVRRWVAQFVDDYKNRVLAHQKADVFYDTVLNALSVQNSAGIDVEKANDLLSRINNMSDEDVLSALVRQK